MGFDREEILSMEDDEEIMSYRFACNNQMMWAYIRMTLFNYLTTRSADKSASIESSFEYRKKISTGNKLKYLFNVFFGATKRLEQKNIMFISSCVYCTEEKKGKYFNWLYDPYAMLFSNDSVSFERSYKYNFYKPRYFQNMKHYDDFLIKETIQRKIKKPQNEDIKTIDRLFVYLDQKSGITIDDMVKGQMKSILYRLSIVLPLELDYWGKVLKKVKPKLLFIDNGSYGGNSHIYKLAHDMGITCCEFQHGIIYKEHYAYNYHENIINNKEYAQYMPDYFLTFGEYWNQMNNSSSKTVTLGSPKITTNRTNLYTKNTSQGKKKIVFISNKNILDYYSEVIKKLILSDLIESKYELHIRPHPGDYSIMDQYVRLSKETRVKLIKDESIGQTLSSADAIISEGSTVIFEALCFDVKIIISESEIGEKVIPPDIGERFKGVDGLIRILEGTNWDEKINVDTEYFFSSNWESNYKDFISRILMKNTQEEHIA